VKILAWVIGGSGRLTRRLPLAGRRLPAGAVLTALVLAGALSPASAQTLTWSRVPSPGPGSGSQLHAVACVSVTACTAVGSYTTARGVGQPLVESWNGTSWSVVPSPSVAGGLSGVSCVSATACTAVGSSGGSTLVESWNGTSWSVVPSPNPSPASSSWLNGVSCVSATACTAAGAFWNDVFEDSLIESWNGTSWSIVASPNPGIGGDTLDGVSCVSVTACTATGQEGDPLSSSRGAAPACRW
jgi:hypothetical protein